MSFEFRMQFLRSKFHARIPKNHNRCHWFTTPDWWMLRERWYSKQTMANGISIRLNWSEKVESHGRHKYCAPHPLGNWCGRTLVLCLHWSHCIDHREQIIIVISCNSNSCDLITQFTRIINDCHLFVQCSISESLILRYGSHHQTTNLCDDWP